MSSVGMQVMQAKRAELEAVLKDVEGVEVPTETSTLVYQYYPPFTPGWLRENEVVLKLRKSPSI